MGWLRLFWLLLIFATFYLALPAFVHGSRPRVSWTIRVAQAFVNLSFFLQFTILGLGMIHMALAGAVFVLYTLWIAATLAYRSPALLPTLDKLLSWKLERRMRVSISPIARAGLAMLAAYLGIVSIFPVHNLRFTQLEGYSRALSLAVLSNGQPWQIDSSVPFLEPLMFFSALPPTLIISLSGPLFACLLVIAVAFLTSQHTEGPVAPLLAGSLAILVSVWRIGLDGGAAGRPEMVATFALLALGLARHAPFSAMLAALTSISMMANGAGAPLVVSGIAFAAVAALLPTRFQSTAAAAVALAFLGAIFLHRPATLSDGPFQYESAARACDRFARTQARNAWAVVSPSQELPFVYGRGWHVELTDFVNKFSEAQVANPAFRFPYPVRDVFFFVESQPLWAADDPYRVGQEAVNVTYSKDPTVLSYFTPIGRATLEFRAAELLAAYGKSHSDLKAVYADAQFSVYRAAGKLD